VGTLEQVFVQQVCWLAVATGNLAALPIDARDPILLRWPVQTLRPLPDKIEMVDGKQVRHAGVKIINAVDAQGRFLGSVLTRTKCRGFSDYA
jgi:hypothetical protein